MALLSRLLGHASDLTPEQTREELDGMLLPEEPVEVAFKLIRDLFVFTDRRLILVDKQGVTSRKIDYLGIPYRAITSYSIETAGTLDLDSELKIWTSGRADPVQKTLNAALTFGASRLPLEQRGSPGTPFGLIALKNVWPAPSASGLCEVT